MIQISPQLIANVVVAPVETAVEGVRVDSSIVTDSDGIATPKNRCREVDVNEL